MWDVSTHWLGKLLRKWSNRDKSDRDRSIFFNTLYKLCLQYYTYFFEIHNSLLQLCMLASFWRNLVKPSFVFPALLFLNFLTPFRSVPEKTLLTLQAGKIGGPSIYLELSIQVILPTISVFHIWFVCLFYLMLSTEESIFKFCLPGCLDYRPHHRPKNPIWFSEARKLITSLDYFWFIILAESVYWYS